MLDNMSYCFLLRPVFKRGLIDLQQTALSRRAPPPPPPPPPPTRCSVSPPLPSPCSLLRLCVCGVVVSVLVFLFWNKAHVLTIKVTSSNQAEALQSESRPGVHAQNVMDRLHGDSVAVMLSCLSIVESLRESSFRVAQGRVWKPPLPLTSTVLDLLVANLSRPSSSSLIQQRTLFITHPTTCHSELICVQT